MAKETAAALNAEAIEQHIAVLADILDRYALSSLEYEVDGVNIKLGKEHTRPAASAIGNAIGSVGSTGFADPTGVTASATTGASVTGAAFENREGTGRESGMAPLPFSASTASTSGSSASVSAVTAAVAKNLVTAPLVGMAYRSQDPGSAAFVNLGDSVEKGAILCLVEAMKMFNEVKAPVAGTITGIHFDDASLVEYGAPLFTLEPVTLEPAVFEPATFEPATAG